MKILRPIVLLCLSAIASIAGRDIPVSVQVGILSALFQAASIIFGILGAWLAIVYPQELQNLFKKDVNLGEVGGLLERIFFPLRISASVVIFCILHTWLSPLLHLVPIFETYKALVRQANFFLTSLAVLATVWALVGVFYPMDSAELHLKSVKNGLARHITRTSGTSKRPKEPDKSS